MGLDGLVNVECENGLELEVFRRFDPSTIQNAVEINRERVGNSSLRFSSDFWTGDYAMYTVEDEEAFLYLGRRETNPILERLKDEDRLMRHILNVLSHPIRSIFELLGSMRGDYRLRPEEIKRVVNSVRTRDTIKLSYSDFSSNLEFECLYRDDLTRFRIPLVNLSGSPSKGGLNHVQKKIAEQLLGSMEKRDGETFSDFEKCSRMFMDELRHHDRMDGGEPRDYITVNVLTPRYIRRRVKEGGAIVRPCMLNRVNWNPSYGATFDATGAHPQYYKDSKTGTPYPRAAVGPMGRANIRGILLPVAKEVEKKRSFWRFAPPSALSVVVFLELLSFGYYPRTQEALYDGSLHQAYARLFVERREYRDKDDSLGRILGSYQEFKLDVISELASE
jgi:hypothetical protein